MPADSSLARRLAFPRRFFRRGFGKSRRDFVQVFLGFFYALDLKADMIETLPQASIKLVMTATDYQPDFAIGERDRSIGLWRRRLLQL